MSSELITSLAERFGASEALISRSAEARAAAEGSSPDAVLAKWSGGGAASATEQPEAPTGRPASEPPAAEEIAPTPEPHEPTEPAPAPPDAPAAAEPSPTATVPDPASVVEPEPAGSLVRSLVGSLVAFAVMFVGVVVAPSLSEDGAALDAVAPVVLTSEAAAGRDVYLAEGCGVCHTQQVRPVVTDAGLGTVTLSDSPLVPGLRRMGPDLTHAGSREPTDDAGWLTDFLGNPDRTRAGAHHSSFGYLSTTDLENLVAYLVESK